MSNEQAWYLHGILTSGGALIGGLTDVTPSTNAERLVSLANGHHEPLYTGISAQKPDVVFSSTSIGQILGLIGAGGNPYCLDLSAGPVDLLYRRGQPQSVRYALANAQHLRMRIAKGLLYWRSIKAAHGQSATIECRLLPLYDGTNQPVVPAGSITLSGTPAVTQLYTLGPVALNGAWLAGVQEWSLSAGEQLEELSGDGELWTTYAGLRQVAPSATIRTHLQPWANIPLTGTALSALKLFLRRKKPDGPNELNATALHIRASTANGLVEAQDARGGAGEPSSTTLYAQFRAASAAAVALAFSIDTAISL